MKNELFASAALALILLGGWATPATAQVKAATVQDQDEPGRRPYYFTFSTSTNAISPTVPAGKRVVLQHISITGAGSGATGVAGISIGLPGSSTQNAFVGVAFFSLGPFYAAGNTQMLQYVDAGQRFVVIPLSTNTNHFGSVTGYIIDCTATSPCAPIAP